VGCSRLGNIIGLRFGQVAVVLDGNDKRGEGSAIFLLRKFKTFPRSNLFKVSRLVEKVLRCFESKAI